MVERAVNGHSPSMVETVDDLVGEFLALKVIGQRAGALTVASQAGSLRGSHGKMVTPDFPLSGRYTCIACQMPRLNGDCTGLTCGDVKCLAALRPLLESAEETQKELRAKLKELSDDKIDVQKDHQEELKKVAADRIEAMNLMLLTGSVMGLDMDVARQDTDIVAACKQVYTAIKQMCRALAKVTG